MGFCRACSGSERFNVEMKLKGAKWTQDTGQYAYILHQM